LLVLWVQSCQEASKEKTYKSYMTNVSDVTGSSQQIGRQLSQALVAQGLKEAQVEQRIAGLARQQQLDVQRAREITPPGTLRDEHNALIPVAPVPRERPDGPRQRARRDQERHGRDAGRHGAGRARCSACWPAT
jgi:hypothetical protein